MGMGLSSGFGAGAGADQLETILTRKFHEAQAIRQAEQQAQALAQRQQAEMAQQALQEREFKQREAYQSGQLKRQETADAANAEDRKTQRDLVNEQRFLSRLSILPKGTRIKKSEAGDFEKYGASGLLNPARQQMPADFVGPTALDESGDFEFGGTQVAADKEAQRGLQDQIADERHKAQLAAIEAANARNAASIAARPPQRDRYQVMPDGKGGLVRVDMDTGVGTPVQMQQGAVVPVKPGPKTVEQIEAEAAARAKGTATGKTAGGGGSLIAKVGNAVFGSKPSANPKEAAASAWLKANGAPDTPANRAAWIKRNP